ncbi:hypothetical protein CLOM_g13320 [Closterium sp. NIES-68]|nr:hypothetical protein CLOM_g13320 [Closterium sp. NIES-68]
MAQMVKVAVAALSVALIIAGATSFILMRHTNVRPFVSNRENVGALLVGAKDLSNLVGRVEDPANSMQWASHADVPPMLDDLPNPLLILRRQLQVFLLQQISHVHNAFPSYSACIASLTSFGAEGHSLTSRRPCPSHSAKCIAHRLGMPTKDSPQ